MPQQFRHRIKPFRGVRSPSPCQCGGELGNLTLSCISMNHTHCILLNCIFLQCWNDPILTKPASQNKDFDVNIIRFQTTKLQIIWQINFRYKYLPRKGCNDLIEEKHTRMTKLVRDQCLCISTSPSPTTATKQDAKVWWYQLKLIIIIVMAREVFFSTSLLKIV